MGSEIQRNYSMGISEAGVVFLLEVCGGLFAFGQIGGQNSTQKSESVLNANQHMFSQSKTSNRETHFCPELSYIGYAICSLQL